MATKVLDSWALMAFFQGEPSAPEVKQLLVQAEGGRHHLLMTVVNWGEVYSGLLRKTTSEQAERLMGEVATMPIEWVPAGADLVLTRQAAVFKAVNKLPYADAFAAALAKLRRAELVTGDPDFKAVEKEIRVHWLR